MIRDKVRKQWLWLIGLLGPIVYGGVIEILQGTFFQPRTSDWLDWLADIIGTIVGTGIVMLIWQARKR
jgi:VanZ family protein